MIDILDKNGKKKAYCKKISYQGTFLGECFVTISVQDETPSKLAIGDYLLYRGEKFVLNYQPPVKKQAKSQTTGEAYVYEHVKFNSLADELTRVEFLDVVPNDNNRHHTSLSEFSFYAGSVKDLAERIQANLDRVFTGTERWVITVNPELVSPDKHITVNKLTCWQALALASSEFGANFIIRNRTIEIGTSGIAVGKVFGYGKGKGLVDIAQTTNEDALIVTRLRAYGNKRNIPNRYYNKLKDKNGKPYIADTAYIPHLMLPDFPYVQSKPSQVFIDSATMGKYGLREGSVYFDGSEDLPDIYPSLEGMTKKQLSDAGISVSLPQGDNGNLDECLSAENPTDNGELPEEGKGKITDEFVIYLKDLGFDLSAKDSNGQYKYATSETMQISMKSGMCVGRTFDVVDKGITKDTSQGYTRYKVRCKRFVDDSIAGGTAFPNNQYKVNAKDKFVLLAIEMPEVYVKAAAQRLLVAAKDYLALHDETKYTYTPKIDEIFMANNPEIGKKIKEGDIFNFTDTDLGIDGSVIIQTLKITEGDKPVPVYEVSLSNERVTGAIEKIQNAISQLVTNNTGITLEQVKSVLLSVGSHYFLSRLEDDTAEGKITFLNDISVEKDLTVHEKLTAKKETVSNRFGNDTFTSGQFGSGFRIWQNPNNGQSYAEFDNLMVRRETIFNVLTIAEMRSVGGQILVSLANMVCSRVEEVSNGYKCFFETDGGTIVNQFQADDQAICRTFNGKDLKYYWRRVLSVGEDYILLSKTDKDGSSVPDVGDDIIQFGNRTDASRQSAIVISAYGSDAPSIKQYSGINSYNLTGKEVTVISPSGNKFTGTFSVKSGNDTIRVPADKGDWTAGVPYYYYDRVSHAGSLWLCVVPEGFTTTQTPSEASIHWQIQVAQGEKGSDGKDGKDGVAGEKGKDGVVYYTWIRYADSATGTGISSNPTNKAYIGFAYNKTSATASNNPSDYIWSLIKGDKGDTGIEGQKGADGRTTYTWIKYSDNADGTGLYDLPKESTKYIGIAVNKLTAGESANKADYTWSLFRGSDGRDGKDGRDGIDGSQGIAGTSSFFHVRYSDNANGNPMKTIPAKYIGTCVTQSATAPAGYASYTWFDWKGAQGEKGIAGTNGANGKTSYLHIKYSNDGGTTFTGNNGEDVGDWLGQYVDFIEADSRDVKMYQWSRLKGDAGTLNYIEWKDEWKVGNSALPNWNNNGSVSKNTRIMGENPFGLQSILWKCVPDATGNNSGGWNTSYKQLDTNYAYRYTVFFYRNKAGGSTYHGCNGVLNIADNSVNSNPYFWSSSAPKNGEWLLMVGYIHPYSVTKQPNMSGVYDMTGKKIANGTDYKFTSDNKAVNFRSYLFYCTDPTVYQLFYNPMVHRLDGTEPSIDELLQISTRRVVDASFEILDNKITSKVSQSEFNQLQGRVSTTESKIEQQAGQITSTVEKVEKKNAVYKSYTSAATDRPAVPYAKGDLWITYDGEIKQSKTTRTSGAFVESDWVATTKYTDDSAIANLQIGGTNIIPGTGDGYGWNGFTGSKTFQLTAARNVESAYIYSPYFSLKGNETYTLSFESKNDAKIISRDLYILSAKYTTNNAIISKVFDKSTDWTKVVWTFKTPAAFTGVTDVRLRIDHNGSTDASSASIWVRNVKLEVGNKATDWSEAPEDMQRRIDNAQAAANTANNKLSEIANDNILTPSEKQDTLKEWQIIQGEKPTVVAQAQTYGVAYATYEARYNTLNSYITPLLANLTVNSAIVGSTFRTNFKNYYDEKIKLLKLVTDAANSKAVDAGELAKAMAYGKMLYKDPTFLSGLNGIYVYNNNGNGMVKVERIAKITGTPTSSTHCLRIQTIGSPTTPGFGGFHFGNTTRANAKFICRFIALIPSGFTVSWHSNPTGTGGVHKWLTPVTGSGKWQEYICMVTCGSTGSFSSTNFFALNGTFTPSASNPITWYVAYATVFDITDSEINYDANRTYYSDTTPAVPVGGHKVGDLWYKISVTNGCYYSYRWNGSSWQQINVNVSKSKIDQTDSSITNLVTKTGINSLGSGETLFSKINQTADKITLEVGKVQVGGRNYVLDSNVYITAANSSRQFEFASLSDFNELRGKQVTVSVDIELSGGSGSRIGFEPSLKFSDGTTQYLSCWHNISQGTSYKGRLSKTYTITNKVISSFGQRGIYIQCTGAVTKIGRPMIELGNKMSDYIPAPEDAATIAGSKLTLTDNKITLGSKTIELNGNVIAKSIAAGDLKVGSRTGTYALEVLKTGVFYAKGTSGSSSLEIDSQNRRIILTNSQSVYTDTGGSKSVTQTVSIRASDGYIESRNSDGHVAYMTSQGILANRAGINPYSATTGVNLKAAIMGLGFGQMNKSSWGSNWGLVGVFGRASNSSSATDANKAPAYGGWFDVCKINGMCMNVRRISGSTTLSRHDFYVSCYNSANINVYLPANPYEGQMILIRRVNSSDVRIYGNGKSIHIDGGLHSNMWHKNGRGDTSIYIYDGQYWMFNYWVR